MLRDQMESTGDEIEDLLVPKPTGCLAMHFERGRLEYQYMAAVFERGHVGIERLPVIADQGHPTGRGELGRNSPALKDRRGRVPTQGFGRFCVAEGFEQPDAAAIGIETVDVVED